MDRVHRLGQQQDVHIYRYSVADSIEERMLALQEQKRDLMKASCCRLGGAGWWEEGFECGGNKGADAAQRLAGHRRLRCRPPACLVAFLPCSLPCRSAGILYHSARLWLQVAFDRRKPDEVRAMRINDVRALMEV